MICKHWDIHIDRTSFNVTKVADIFDRFDLDDTHGMFALQRSDITQDLRGP